MTNDHVEYWANDLKLKAWVRIKVSVEEFLDLLIQHVPEKYAHNVRYFGLASPAGKHLVSSAVFALLGEAQKRRPKRLSFEAMSVKYFDFNPLLDSHGQRMRGRAPGPCIDCGCSGIEQFSIELRGHSRLSIREGSSSVFFDENSYFLWPQFHIIAASCSAC